MMLPVRAGRLPGRGRSHPATEMVRQSRFQRGKPTFYETERGKTLAAFKAELGITGYYHGDFVWDGRHWYWLCRWPR